MLNPYASPESQPVAQAQDAEQALRTHQSRAYWLGLWNAGCGVLGLLFTAFVGLVATNVNFWFLLLWLLFWSARTLVGVGMTKHRRWAQWLGVPVHLLMCLGGVSSVIGGLGLWVLLGDQGQRTFNSAPPSQLAPRHDPAWLALLTLLVLFNWAVPLWFFIFVLGPMV